MSQDQFDQTAWTSGLRARWGQLLQNRVGRQVGWIVIPHAGRQLIRLAGNVVLTRLLAPEVFGLMLMVNSLRTGAELLSDIGIGQSVVRSPNGDDPKFLDVSWTLQLLRGILLTVLMASIAVPIGKLYGKPELGNIILALSPIFILTGAQSTSLFTIQRKMRLDIRAYYDFFTVITSVGFPIVLALFIKSVWALVIALLLSTAASTIATFFVDNRRLPRLAWDRAFVHEIASFGKWIFLSTAVFFAASSFDRLYFVGSIPIALAGIYGISRTYSDILGLLAQRAGAYLVFPKVASIQDRREEMADRLKSTRRKMLIIVSIATGLAVACSDQFILLVYDARYHAAAFMTPILLVSVWFGVLSAFADSMLMGCGKAAPGAYSNFAKFAVLLIGLPIAVSRGDFFVALLTMIFAEVVRWAALQVPAHNEGFSAWRDDLELTLLMLIVAFAAKILFSWIGVVPTPAQWWKLRMLM